MLYRRIGLMKKRNSQSSVIPKKMSPMTAIATMFRAVRFHSKGDLISSYMPFQHTHTHTHTLANRGRDTVQSMHADQRRSEVSRPTTSKCPQMYYEFVLGHLVLPHTLVSLAPSQYTRVCINIGLHTPT